MTTQTKTKTPLAVGCFTHQCSPLLFPLQSEYDPEVMERLERLERDLEVEREKRAQAENEIRGMRRNVR